MSVTFEYEGEFCHFIVEYSRNFMLGENWPISQLTNDILNYNIREKE